MYATEEARVTSWACINGGWTAKLGTECCSLSSSCTCFPQSIWPLFGPARRGLWGASWLSLHELAGACSFFWVVWLRTHLPKIWRQHAEALVIDEDWKSAREERSFQRKWSAIGAQAAHVWHCCCRTGQGLNFPPVIQEEISAQSTPWYNFYSPAAGISSCLCTP